MVNKGLLKMVMRIPPHTEAVIEITAISSMVVHLFNNALGGLFITPDMAEHITLTMIKHDVAVRCMWSDVNARMGVDEIEAMVIPLSLIPQIKQHIIFNCNLVLDDIELLIMEYFNNVLPARTWDIVLVLESQSQGASVRIVNEGDFRIKEWVDNQLESAGKYSRIYRKADLGLVNEIHFFH